jgi:hypothetical protein
MFITAMTAVNGHTTMKMTYRNVNANSKGGTSASIEFILMVALVIVSSVALVLIITLALVL